jgi:hypothetical protein
LLGVLEGRQYPVGDEVIDVTNRRDGGSGYPQYQVESPATTEMRSFASKVVHDVLVVATSLLNRVRQDREPVELAVSVHSGGECHDGWGEPKSIEAYGAKRVAKNLSKHGSLLASFIFPRCPPDRVERRFPVIRVGRCTRNDCPRLRAGEPKKGVFEQPPIRVKVRGGEGDACTSVEVSRGRLSGLHPTLDGARRGTISECSSGESITLSTTDSSAEKLLSLGNGRLRRLHS